MAANRFALALAAAAAGFLASLALALAAWAPVAHADDAVATIPQQQPADPTAGDGTSSPPTTTGGSTADQSGGNTAADPGAGTVDQSPTGGSTGTGPSPQPDPGPQTANDTGTAADTSGSTAGDASGSSGGAPDEPSQKGSSTRADDHSAPDGGRDQGASSGTTAAGGGPGATSGQQGLAGTPTAPTSAGAPLPLVPIGSNLMAFEVVRGAGTGGAASGTVQPARLGGFLLFGSGGPPRPPGVRDKAAAARAKFSPLPPGTGIGGLPGQQRDGLFNLMGGGGGGASFLFFGLLGILALTLLLAPNWTRALLDFAEAIRPSAYLPPIESPG